MNERYCCKASKIGFISFDLSSLGKAVDRFERFRPALSTTMLILTFYLALLILDKVLDEYVRAY